MKFIPYKQFCQEWINDCGEPKEGPEIHLLDAYCGFLGDEANSRPEEFEKELDEFFATLNYDEKKQFLDEWETIIFRWAQLDLDTQERCVKVDALSEEGKITYFTNLKELREIAHAEGITKFESLYKKS